MSISSAVNSDQFRRYLAKQGCTFEPGKGGHLIVRRDGKRSVLPQHGGSKQLKTGLMRGICKDLGIEQETMMYDYPVDLSDDDGTVLVQFPDVPGAITFGEDEADAMAHAVDALETMLAAYIIDREELPTPSAAQGRPTVSPTLLGSLKLGVYAAMRDKGWRKADLARAMDLNPRQIDRLLDLRHASTLAQLSRALAVCGRRASIELRDAA